MTVQIEQYFEKCIIFVKKTDIILRGYLGKYDYIMLKTNTK